MKKIALALAFVFSSTFADYFSVSDVEVKARAENSYIAQQHAQQRAMMQAFTKMLSVEFADINAGASRFTNSEVTSCVYDYSIDREKFSGKVFIGRFSFRFDKDKVQQILQRHNLVASVDTSSNDAVFAVFFNDFIRHNALFKKYNAVVVKFNNQKVVFKMNASDAKNILRKIRCVRL